MSNLNRPLTQMLRGWAFPNEGTFKAVNITAAMDYRPLDGDVIISSYPRSGSTWTTYIVRHILNQDKSLPALEDLSSRLSPFFEKSTLDVWQELQPPRIFKTHIPYHLQTINDDAKYIYVYRNPKDVVASYFTFLNAVSDGRFDFDPFFDCFMSGEIAFGDFCDYALSFHAHKDEPHLLLLSYEELLKNTREQVLKIAEFLGDQYLQGLKQDEQSLQDLLKSISFDNMKKNIPVRLSSKPTGEKVPVDFFRKGVSGDGNNLLSEEQSNRLREKISSKMSGTLFADEWKI